MKAFLVAFLFGVLAQAQDTMPGTGLTNPLESIPVSIMPNSPMDMNNFVVAGTSTRSEAAPFILNLHLNCTRGSIASDFPIATSTSTIGLSFSLRPGNGTITVRFPANYLGKHHPTENPMPYLSLPPENILGPGRGGVRASIAGNLVRIEIPAPQVAIDPANPSENIPKLAEDFYFTSLFGANANNVHITGGPPNQWVAQRVYDHLYQGSGSYSADLDVTFPAGTSDPERAPLYADFANPGGANRRTNVLDCRGALSP